MVDVRVVIPSRGRADTIGGHSLRFLPDATVTVNESEMEDYLRAGVPEKQLLPHPEMNLLPKVRNWIIDNVDAEFVVQADDDITHVRFCCGWHVTPLKDPAAVAELLEQTAVCARDAGAYFFGYSQDYNQSHVMPMEPFHLTGWIAAVEGLVRGHGLRFNENDRTGHLDIDMSLQNLLKHRIIWRDDRVCWVTLRNQNAGGVAATRTEERNRLSNEAMKRAWGQYVEVRKPVKRTRWDGSDGNARSTVATVVNVPRRRRGMVD